jgi:hypothetical protein
MKISIGINGYKSYDKLEKREQLCIDSLLKFKSKRENVELYNICYEHENINYNGFKTIFMPFKNNKLPFVCDILDTLSKTECDIFLFMNNDIVVSNKLYNIFDEHETYAISRMHLHSLESLDEELKMQAYSVHGFDAFAFKKTWWNKNSNKFLNYYIGKPYWDTHYMVICMLNSNCKVVNKLPPVIFHAEHHSTACTTIDKESLFNENEAKKHPEMQYWWNYVFTILNKRQTYNNILWYLPFDNEEDLEKRYFKK